MESCDTDCVLIPFTVVHHRLKIATSMVKASLLLYNLLSAKLSRNYDYYVDLLKDSISLMLFSIAQLNFICPPDERKEKDDTIQSTFDGLQTTLWKWIVHSDVIGGSVFGGGRIFTNSKREEELKVVICSFYSLSRVF